MVFDKTGLSRCYRREAEEASKFRPENRDEKPKIGSTKSQTNPKSEIGTINGSGGPRHGSEG